MGLFDFFKRKTPTAAAPKAEKKLSYADKERIMVERVTIDDMRQFTGIPYAWNTKVKKFIKPHGHPFAYIDLIGPNIAIAKQELDKMNEIIASCSKLSPVITKRLSIPVDKIVFTPQEHFGHTRLMCTPRTVDGTPSRYPASLSFMTDLSNSTTATHGELFYSQDGNIGKAEVFFDRKSGLHSFYFCTVDGVLVLETFENDSGAIYEAPHILARRAQLEQETHDFAWLQENLPNQCPKSISGFRRMKTQNTKNYQALKQAAAEMGREI